MQIDCYGFEATSEFFQRRRLEVYRIKTVGDDTYIAFREEIPSPIHRVRKADGEYTVTWANGAWADAASLDYIPINETRNV